MLLYSSEDIPNFTSHDISESNIKCETCTRQLWSDTSKKIVIEGTTFLLKDLNNIDNKPGDCIFNVCKKTIRTLIYYFFTNIDEETALLENSNF